MVPPAAAAAGGGVAVAAVAAVVAAEDAAVAVGTELPFLGAGVSYRDAWRWEVIRHRDALGVVECIPDDVAGEAGIRELVMIRDAVPVTLHGIGLSLGSTGGLDPERVRHMARVAEAAQPPWLSEHIALTRAGGGEVGHPTRPPSHRRAAAAPRPALPAPSRPRGPPSTSPSPAPEGSRSGTCPPSPSPARRWRPWR